MTTAADRTARGRLSRTAAAIAARRTRAAVHRGLVDALDVLRYQAARWGYDRHGRIRPDDPAGHAHTWRALADDCDTLITWLSAVRDAARDEHDRLSTLDGDHT